MIPDAILLRIARLFLILAAALVFGVIFGIATDDKILLLLSIALAVTGGIKIGILFFSARKREYEIVEGTVNSLRRIPVRKCCALTVTNGDGVEMEIIGFYFQRKLIDNFLPIIFAVCQLFVFQIFRKLFIFIQYSFSKDK